MSIPYATVTQFKDFVDERLLAELGADAESDGAVTSGNTIIMAALTRASHELQTFALRGGAYTTDDLDDLQTAGNMMLIGIVCDLALGVLLSRRGGPYGDALSDRMNRTNAILGDLRAGHRVFPVSTTVAATQPSLSVITLQQRGALGMVADSEFFPRRHYTAVQ